MMLGRMRPDGTRRVTVTDDSGLVLHGDVGPEPADRLRPASALTPADVAYLVAIAGRAPSLHNTQPWRFRAYGNVVELIADRDRKLNRIDPAGREMLISCGAALYGLRLGLRKLGYIPKVELLPCPDAPELIGRVSTAGQAAVTRHEDELLASVYHRHTHRGPFTPGDVSSRLLAGLRMDAAAEQAELVVLDRPGQLDDLVDLVLRAAAEQAADPEVIAELSQWVRPAGTQFRDGIPAFARVQAVSEAGPHGAGGGLGPGRLPQRDFGQPGTAPLGGHSPALTAVLMTGTDSPIDWIRAGQALHRMLLHAATRWLFASLQSQPLESPALRAELAARLGLAGEPQLLLQFGRSNTAPATARRPVSETLTPGTPAPS